MLNFGSNASICRVITHNLYYPLPTRSRSVLSGATNQLCGVPLRNNPSYKPPSLIFLQSVRLRSFLSHTFLPFPYSDLKSVSLHPSFLTLIPLWHSTMSVRPLPGASYHTFDTFPYTDIEAIGHFDTLPSYDIEPFDEKHGLDTFHHGCRCKQHLHQTRDRRQRRCCGLPVLFSLIVFCCLAFLVSAFWKISSDPLPLPVVSGRHASLADRLASTFQTQSHRAMVDEHYENAKKMMCVPPS